MLRAAFANAVDPIQSQKMTELIEKVAQNLLIIGFCGHFSAGKSSMINYLIGEDVLPASPIPTTAKLARISSHDEKYAQIYFENSHPIQLSYPYDLDTVDAFIPEGDEIMSFEISHPFKQFPKGITFLDTPGIDSTDDAHRIATESSLHLADVICYVTDYNHVLSQMNFTFLKQLQQQGKEILLIVNQIDK